MMTPKQENFVNTYLELGNATEAASRVYKPKKRATARSIGSENLTKPDIQKKIEDELRENGLEASLVIKSLVADIKGKPMERLGELMLASKLLGLFEKAKKAEAKQMNPIPIMGGLSVQSIKPFEITPEQEQALNGLLYESQ
jgi:hypothetical protein